jgi:hypothetical protein
VTSVANILSGPTILFTSETESDDQQLQEQVVLQFDHRRYPGALPVALSVSAFATGFYAQSWASQDRHEDLQNAGSTIVSDEQRRTESWLYDHAVSGRLGAGVGRVRNATGVYEARVLEERLRQSGAIAQPLSPTARRRLAELAYLRADAAEIHDRPARSVWAEIEEILIEDGAVAEAGLGPEAILRALEPHVAGSTIDATGIPVSPVLRARGHFVGMFAELQHRHGHVRQDSEQSRSEILNGVPQPPVYIASGAHDTFSEDRVLAGLEAESHVPLDLNLQLDVGGRVLVPVREEDTELVGGATADFAWMVADRWLARTQARYQWLDTDRRTGATPGDRWDWVFGFELDYYLENRATLFAIAFDRQSSQRGGQPGFGPTDSYARDRGISVGITYRLAGRYAAPGFDHLGL